MRAAWNRLGFGARTVGAVARRPDLWGTALRQAGRSAPRAWWRRPPFLPIPDPSYLRFRLETQYGIAPARDPADVPADVVVFLEWCHASNR